MNIIKSISSCMSKFATFSGTASRSEFWWFFLAQILALIVTALLFGPMTANFVSLALLLPTLAVGTRRLHDIDKSGWWQLLTLTLIGYFLLIYWWATPSQTDSI